VLTRDRAALRLPSSPHGKRRATRRNIDSQLDSAAQLDSTAKLASRVTRSREGLPKTASGAKTRARQPLTERASGPRCHTHFGLVAPQEWFGGPK